MSIRPRRRRSRASLALLAIAVPCALAPSISHASVPGGGSRNKDAQPRVVFEDDFWGPNGAMPDATKWSPIEAGGGFGNGEMQFYTKSPYNVSLDGRGHLRLMAQRIREHDGGFYYTSGKVVSLMYPYLYGHAEARIKVPAGQGLWPAFWMLGVGDGPVPQLSGPVSAQPLVDVVGHAVNWFSVLNPLAWPASGEIDVMESVGRYPRTVFGSIHGPKKKLKAGDGKGAYDRTGKVELSKPLSAGWHIYAVDSAPGVIKFSVDGKIYKTLERSDLKPGETWVYDRPFKLILNLAVGGDWPGPPTSRTHFPAQMLVDYVRVTSTDQGDNASHG